VRRTPSGKELLMIGQAAALTSANGESPLRRV
jgi:hypothetical protein